MLAGAEDHLATFAFPGVSQTVVKHSTWGQCPQVLAGTARKVAKSTRLCSYTGPPLQIYSKWSDNHAQMHRRRNFQEAYQKALLERLLTVYPNLSLVSPTLDIQFPPLRRLESRHFARSVSQKNTAQNKHVKVLISFRRFRKGASFNQAVLDGVPPTGL